jgi:hypothetical protein
MESILTSIKKLLGIDEADAHFDVDIIMHINTAFMTLYQLGVGPSKCFKITTDEQTWTDFLGESGDFEAVKTYIYRKVRANFDPPSSSFVLDALDRQTKEDEFRLMIQAEMEALDDGTET